MATTTRPFKSIFSNFKTKLLALVIALGIWFYASSRLTEERPVTVTLTLTAPDEYILLDPGPVQVNTIVSGPTSLVETVRSNATQDQAHMRHLLTAAELAEVKQDALQRIEVQVQPEWMSYGLREWEAARLKLVEVKPPSVSVLVSRKQTRTLPVHIRVPHGAELPGELEWQPREVEVTGPAGVLSQMESIGLQNELRVLDAGTSSSVFPLQSSRTVVVDGTPVTVRFVLSQPNVKVLRTAAAAPTEEEEIFENVPVRLVVPVNFGFKARIAEEDPRTVSVRVRAMPESMNRLRRAIETNPSALSAYVDLGNLPEDVRAGETYKEQVRVRLPNAVSATQVAVPDPDNPNVNLELTIALEEIPPAL